jgi:GntR family transcriptional regulator, galactonate operon transcriptional repressor
MNSSVGQLYPSGGTHGAVVHALGVAIVTGKYEPGTAIPTEEKLAIQFSVGRPAVREAIRVLSGKGLVKATAGRGTIVQPPSTWHLLDPDILRWRYEESPTSSTTEDLTGLRLVLEPAAARFAALSTSTRILDPIEAALNRMKASVDDTDAFVDADLAFHAAIVEATENQLLIHLNSMMAVALHAQRRIHTTSKTRHLKTLPAHRRVLDAIREHAADDAEIRSREIIEHAHQDFLYYTGRARRSGASASRDID